MNSAISHLSCTLRLPTFAYVSTRRWGLVVRWLWLGIGVFESSCSQPLVSVFPKYNRVVSRVLTSGDSEKKYESFQNQIYVDMCLRRERFQVILHISNQMTQPQLLALGIAQSDGGFAHLRSKYYQCRIN
jgi:hypothetical protein